MSPTQMNHQLSRDPLGRLVYTGNGETHVGVVPVRAFPIGQPDRGISLVSPDGHELVWIDQLTDLPENHRQLVEEELAGREFMPEIRRLKGVSAFVTPSTWTVETDRGTVDFILKGEEDIRRISGPVLLVSDSNGIHYLIRDVQKLDRQSRKLLDRFL